MNCPWQRYQLNQLTPLKLHQAKLLLSFSLGCFPWILLFRSAFYYLCFGLRQWTDSPEKMCLPPA